MKRKCKLWALVRPDEEFSYEATLLYATKREAMRDQKMLDFIEYELVQVELIEVKP